MLLKNIPSCEQIEKTICHHNKNRMEINDTLFFNELTSLLDFVSGKIKEWADKDENILSIANSVFVFLKSILNQNTTLNF